MKYKTWINLLITLSVLLLATKTYSQSFYDINNIQSLELTFAQSNWDYMLDTAKAGSEGYIMAKSISINGMLFDSVGVKYKGNSTYNPGFVKNPFHIELDTYKNQDYQGYTDIKLSNAAKDPSFLREALSYSILRQYMDASLSNYANVSVNGNLIGLYVNSESVSKKFVNNHFYSNDNSFFKCNPISGAGPGSTNLPNLVYMGPDSASYSKAYEMNSDHGWNDLINLCNTLKNNVSSVETVLDVDRALWMIAFDNILVNLDSYIGGFTQNYYLYKDNTGRFNSILWDFNESFGTFNNTGTINLPNTTAKIQMTHLLHSGDANWPLIQKLLSVPAYKKMYLAHLHTILNENFANDSYITTAQAMQTVINAAVQADPNKFFTYAQYQSNLNNDVTSGQTSAPGITKLMDGRNTYLSALPDFTNTKPVISNVAPNTANPELNTVVFITADVTNTNSVKLGYRYAIADKFTKIEMFDDGAHGDGAAGDHKYGASILVSNTFIQYYIYAENANVGMFSPVRAEHEFYTVNALIPVLTPGDLVVNEIMAQNLSAVPDQDGEFDDWIELYNNTTAMLSLENLYMTDASSNLLKWKFPSGTTIDPNGYLIIWADEDLTQSGLHANFKLSASGENVVLSYDNGTVIEAVAFGAQVADQGYARNPNGTGDFVIQHPTFSMNNQSGLGFDEESARSGEITLFQNYPNPFSQQTTIKYSLSDDLAVQIRIFDMHGREIETLVDQLQMRGNYSFTFDAEKNAIQGGVYYCRITTAAFSKTIKMVYLR